MTNTPYEFGIEVGGDYETPERSEQVAFCGKPFWLVFKLERVKDLGRVNAAPNRTERSLMAMGLGGLARSQTSLHGFDQEVDISRFDDVVINFVADAFNGGFEGRISRQDDRHTA